MPLVKVGHRRSGVQGDLKLEKRTDVRQITEDPRDCCTCERLLPFETMSANVYLFFTALV